jgi:RNA 3'-terminal phosphate cyclase (ATP)
MIDIDASMGEGGGQIVRSSLALAACTGAAIALRNIRAHRDNPGLRAQHLAAVRAAAVICGARTAGANVASRDLLFEPGAVRPGRYEVDVGTAGSTMLVLQTILPALSLCSAPSEILLHGGTHNPRAPTFEFVRDSYLPLLERLGFKAQITLQRHGFFPRGGGAVRALIEPVRRGCALELIERGAVRTRSATVLLSGLPEHIAQREIGTVRARLGLPEHSCNVQNVTAHGAGNVMHVRIDCTNVTAVFAGFGARGVPAERVAAELAAEVERYLEANVAVDAHLADQLLLPLALAAGGSFSTLRPTAHTETNAAVIHKFLPIDYETSPLGPERWTIAVRPRSAAVRSGGTHVQATLGRST